MKVLKRMLSLLLALTFILQMLTGCGGEDSSYMSKGEFYALLIETFNYYPLDHTVEEMRNAPNYDIEAKTMADWYLLPEDIALENPEGAITREIAAIACVNTLYIRNKGDIAQVKDAELCQDSQAMADAVANGILTLENGYINGKEEITKEECIAMLDATLEAKATNNFAEDEGEVGLSDAFLEITAEDLQELGEGEFYVSGYEEALENYYARTEENAEPQNVSLTTNVRPSLLTLENVQNTENQNEEKPKTEEFRVNMTKNFYNSKFKDCQVGQFVAYTGRVLENPNKSTSQSPTLSYQELPFNDMDPFAGKLLRVIDSDVTGTCPFDWHSPYPCVTLVLEVLPDDEVMANTEVKKVALKKVAGIDFKKIEINEAGFKFTIQPISKGTGIECVAKKTFKLTGNEYSNWKDWKETPTVTIKGAIKNIRFGADNLQNFFKKNNNTGILTVMCDTEESFTLESSGMRLAPATNGNGKAWNNITKSRFTNGDGATEIKLAQIPIKIPYTGLTINVYVYLVIGMDGKLTISFSQFDNGFEIKKNQNGRITVSPIKSGKTQKSLTGEANLTVELIAKVYIDFFLIPRRSVMGGYIALGMDTHFRMALYEKEEKEMKVVNAGYGDNQEAEQAIKKHTNLHYCADLDTQFYVSIGMLKNSPNSAQMEERVTALHLVAKKFEIDITKSTYTTKDTEKAIRVSVGHIENFKVVGECTVDASLQEEAKKKEEENFVLSTTKLVIEENGFGTVRVLGYPLSDADVEKNSGVKVKSKNENVAVVRYNSATKTITVDAVAPGSTEVEVYLQKKKTSKKQYVQVFSVTVNAEGNVALVNEDMHFCLGEGERYCA